MTNAEKFKEVFNLEPDTYICPFSSGVHCYTDCKYFDYKDSNSMKCVDRFWNEEYKENTNGK